VWRVRMLLLLVLTTCLAGHRSHAASQDAEFDAARQRATFFAWCTGAPIMVPTPTYGKLAAIDDGCARLAEARTKTYRELRDAALANQGHRRGFTFGDIAFSFPFAVCREMTARRRGQYSLDVACSSRDQRMVDAALDLPGLFDAYRRQQIETPNAEISPAPWNQQAKDRIAKLLAVDPLAMNLRRYLEKIGCRCDMTRAGSLSCFLLFQETGYKEYTRYLLGVTWMITFKVAGRGEAMNVEASVEQHLIP